MIDEPASAMVDRQISTKPIANAFMPPPGAAIFGHEAVWRLRLLETKADGRACTALCAVGCSARGTKYRHQDFTCFATDRSIALDGPDNGSSRPRITLCAGRTLRSLRPLGTLLALCPLLPLWPSNTLQALRALRTGGALRAGFPLRPWISPAASEHHRRAHCDGHQKRSHSVFSSSLPHARIKGGHSQASN